ncbi:hypothetical protein DOTSEDRAFT_78888 [Dothistroma septosporum NZE10]|uniref:Uncharacterized protein n=1 Tax=Dothistroma septosporum (strain NZE10 / CBS 128990) TaxID=675120 RepID=N1PTI2_DOTSN|nr:hypothetical protein DOTSEDRAFT_78888 [Dothistroma septosporum NZE10]
MSVENKYKPTGGPAKGDQAWKDMVAAEDRLITRAVHIETQRGDPKTLYLVIIDARSELPELARKIPGPVRPDSLRTPSPSLPPSMPPPPYPSSASIIATDGSATGEKRRPPTLPTPDSTAVHKEIIDVDSDEDNEDHLDDDYDPVEDASTEREERAKKRQQTENKDNFAARIRKMEEEDLEYQLKEIPMKADMQKLAVERKLAALRRARKEKEKEKEGMEAK